MSDPTNGRSLPPSEPSSPNVLTPAGQELVPVPAASLAARPVDAGLLLREATCEEFLPSVRPWVRAAGLVLLGSFAAGIGLMAVWPYRVVVRGMGLVRPSGETSVINAPFAGRVRQVLVQSNQPVRAGQVLAVLDPTDLQGKQQQLRQSQQALAQQELALQRQGDAALQAAELEVRKSEASLRFAQAEYLRFQQLAGTGSITTTQLEEKVENFNVARANLAKAQQAVAEQRSRSLSERAQLERELAANRAEVAQVGRDLGITQVKAPVNGVLFSLNLRNPQQVVAPGEELARIAPSDARLMVKVLVPSQDITNVEIGQRADLRIAGCPYPDYGTLRAEVVSLAPEATVPSSGGERDGGRSSGGAPPAPAAAGGGGYEVTLKPHGTLLRSRSRTCQLRQGMDLSADITTRIETVLQFLLRKLRLMGGL